MFYNIGLDKLKHSPFSKICNYVKRVIESNLVWQNLVKELHLWLHSFWHTMCSPTSETCHSVALGTNYCHVINSQGFQIATALTKCLFVQLDFQHGHMECQSKSAISCFIHVLLSFFMFYRFLLTQPRKRLQRQVHIPENLYKNMTS